MPGDLQAKEGTAFMARKRDRIRAPVPRKSAFEVGLQDELRRQKRPAFKARLAAAEQSAEWQRFKQHFESIAAGQEPIKRTNAVASPAARSEWEAIIKKHVPVLPWKGTGKAWLLGNGEWKGAFVKYPPEPGEKLWAPDRPDDYCRRIVRKARDAFLRMEASTVKRWYPSRPNK